jgi:hypothetical protein
VWWAVEAMNNRDLIEQVRKVNKLLSLYVLSLQEEMMLTANDHYGLARALRSLTEAIEQEARKPPVESSGDSRPLIQGSVGHASQVDTSTTES